MASQQGRSRGIFFSLTFDWRIDMLDFLYLFVCLFVFFSAILDLGPIRTHNLIEK